MPEFASRCYRCMQPIVSENDICPHCGHDNHVRTSGYGYLPACVLQNQYLVGHALGRGGFGITYIGYDLILDRVVAVKEYFPAEMSVRINESFSLSAFSDCTEDFRKGCARALRESRIAARVQNIPGVVQIYNAFTANNTIYIVMEYIDGETFTKHLDQRGGRMPWPQVLALINPVMDTLIRLHGADIVHRDVKPDNIMIRRSDGMPVLLDFGAAQTISNDTISHSTTRSLGYAPLEQYNSDGAIDGRLDQYALCATMLRALTGKRPPEATSRILNPDAHIISCTADNQLTESARAAILRGFSIQAEDRFGSVAQLKAALNADNAEAKAKAEAEAKRKAEAEAKAKAEAEAKRKAEAEAKAKAEAEAKRKAEAEAEAKARAEAEAKRKAEAEAKARAEAEAKRKAEAEAEAKARAEAEAKRKAEAEAKARAEAEAKHKAEEEAKARPETIDMSDLSAVLKAREQVEARIKAKAEAEAAARRRLRIRLLCIAFIIVSVIGLMVGYFVAAKNNILSVPAFLEKYVYFETNKNYGGKTLALERYTGTSKTVTVPEEIGGKPVTKIGRAFSSDDPDSASTVIEVILPDTISEIGSSAFENCTSLTTISIPDSVKQINSKAFLGCTALTEINIPDSVTQIGGYAFYGCTALTKINIPNSVTRISDRAFSGCTALTEISIPNSVTEIGKYAFNECTALTKINIPDSVTQIGSCAFIGCTALTEINIPDSVSQINEGLIYNCSSLKSVTIPRSITRIGRFVFNSDDPLESYFRSNQKGIYSFYLDPFTGCPNLTLIVEPCSAAEEYAKRMEIPFRYAD